MDDNDWTKVGNHKRQKQRIRQKEREKERIIWDNLKKEIPHIVMPSRAFRLKGKLRIDNLDKKLMSDEVIEHQRKGWVYVKVIKPDDDEIIPKDEDYMYSVLDVDNKWGDRILFSINISEHINKDTESGDEK